MAARVGRAISTDHKEEVQNVGQGQGGQAKQPQQGCHSCQPIPTELWHVKSQEAYHDTCNIPLFSSAKQNSRHSTICITSYTLMFPILMMQGGCLLICDVLGHEPVPTLNTNQSGIGSCFELSSKWHRLMAHTTTNEKAITFCRGYCDLILTGKHAACQIYIHLYESHNG